jgi:hypothetical protein
MFKWYQKVPQRRIGDPSNVLEPDAMGVGKERKGKNRMNAIRYVS